MKSAPALVFALVVGSSALAGAEEAPTAAEVRGTVVGPGGEPAVGAIVAVVARNRTEPAAVTVTGAGGAFAATVPAGTYALTATHPQWTAAYSPPAEASGKVVRDLRLLAPAEGFLLAGDVRDSTGAALGGAQVQCLRSFLRSDIFIGRADGAGRYALRLPSAPHTCRAVDGEKRSAFFEVAAGAPRQDLVIRLPVPAPPVVVDWIRGQAVPLLTPRAGHGFADMAPLRDVVGGARVVALGEPTHGTREVFQMKHRMLEYLVAELGFSVFALEANWPESEAVDEYVRTGEGDPAEALAGMYFWTWNTEEVLDLIRWMRQWNAVPGHRQVRFYGFDMQMGAVAAERLAARLRQIDPELAAAAGPALARLAAEERAETGPTDEGLAAVAALLPRIAERLGTPTPAADRQALVDRRYVEVLRQYVELGSDPLGNPQVRDRAMADNVRWIADVAEPGSRIVLWAHNGHIANADHRFTSLGHHLEAELGTGYLPVGFLFHHGGFQALDATGGRRGLHGFTVGPPPAGTLEDTFERAGWPLCLLDLRRLPASGPVAEWFRGLHPMREIGAVFRSEPVMATEVVLPDRYEAVIYVEATTRARPNPSARSLAAAGVAPPAGAEAPADAEVSGTVAGPGGEPAAGAVVAVVAPRRSEPVAVVIAGAGGAFAATVPAGTYALTATHPRWTAAYSPPAAVSGKAVRDLRLAAPGEGFVLAGDVRDSTGAALAGAEVYCLRSLQGDLFAGRPDGAGRYALRLPTAPYACRAVMGGLRSPFVDVAAGAARQDLTIRRPAPAPPAVVDWVRGQAVPLLTPRAGHGFADLAPLRDVVGGARVVALGEATHGTREFFQTKHRLLEYLVAELGFSVFALEANWPESEAVDEYVRTGEGDPAKALAGLYFWTWNTEEVLDLVRWMRRWNSVPGHRQVRFYGFDVRSGAVAAERLAARLREIDPELAAEVRPALAALAADERADAFEAENLAAVAAALPRIAARLPEPSSAADRQALVDRHYVQVLQQHNELWSGSRGGGVRDRAMADNVRWIADAAEPGSRIVVWAHNAHVVKGPFPSMGHHLEAALGEGYLPVGFLFHHGSFQAIGESGGKRGLHEFALGPPAAGTLEDTFERAGWPLGLLDLRRLPASGAVAEWFRSPQPMREVGAGFTGEADTEFELVLPNGYEAVIYVEATTRARPNPGAEP